MGNIRVNMSKLRALQVKIIKMYQLKICFSLQRSLVNIFKILLPPINMTQKQVVNNDYTMNPIEVIL